MALPGTSRQNDKTMRLHAQTAMIENGFVHIPETAPWLAEYLHEMTVFPKGKHGRFDRAIPGLVQDTHAGLGDFRADAPAGAGARAAPQAATHQNRMGPWFHGVGRRAGESAVSRGT